MQLTKDLFFSIKVQHWLAKVKPSGVVGVVEARIEV